MNAKTNPRQTKKSSWMLIALITMTFVLAACAPAATPSPQAAAPTAPPATEVALATQPPATPTQAPAEPTIKVASDAKLGQILVDGDGMTLYMFTKDEPDKVNCAGQCLENWPPLLTQGNPTLGEGIDPALVSTAPMADGTLIVTYNHMPLYYWIRDNQPGDTTGQGNNDVWYVVAPDGNPVGYTMVNANDNGNTNSNQNSNDNSGGEDDNDNNNSNDNSNDNSGG